MLQVLMMLMKMVVVFVNVVGDGVDYDDDDPVDSADVNIV
jgi:hypothetical protein